MDDIFRENYSQQMQGKHLFGQLKNFCAKTNKILVDYNKFKKWLFSNLKKIKRGEKELSIAAEPSTKIEGVLKDLVDPNSNKISHADVIKSKLNESIKKGRFTEDLFNEVQNIIG